MALRKVGPVGLSNIKTYPTEAAVSRGCGVKVGACHPDRKYLNGYGT